MMEMETFKWFLKQGVNNQRQWKDIESELYQARNSFLTSTQNLLRHRSQRKQQHTLLLQNTPHVLNLIHKAQPIY